MQVRKAAKIAMLLWRVCMVTLAMDIKYTLALTLASGEMGT